MFDTNRNKITNDCSRGMIGTVKRIVNFTEIHPKNVLGQIDLGATVFNCKNESDNILL